MPEILQNSFDVTIGSDVFTFRVPSIRFDIEVSYKAAEVRRRAYPAGGGSTQDMDNMAYAFSRGIAYMELYLERANVDWPWSAGKDGKPTIDFERFPAHKGGAIYDIVAGFDEEYGRFRRTGSFNREPVGEEVVAGQPNSGP
jgi:hypothetical protein